jgi:pyruvate carboxylase subunit B
LTGKGKIDIPLKKKEEEKTAAESKPSVPMTAGTPISGPVKSKCIVEENGKSRTFYVTLEPIEAGSSSDVLKSSDPSPSGNGEAVYSTFAGTVDIVDILVKVGSEVSKGQVVAQVEAMKAKHDIKAPKNGTVLAILVDIGDEIDSTKPILTIA